MDAVKRIRRYLRGTIIKDTILRPDKEKLLEVLCDVHFQEIGTLRKLNKGIQQDQDMGNISTIKECN